MDSVTRFGQDAFEGLFGPGDYRVIGLFVVLTLVLWAMVAVNALAWALMRRVARRSTPDASHQQQLLTSAMNLHQTGRLMRRRSKRVLALGALVVIVLWAAGGRDHVFAHLLLAAWLTLGLLLPAYLIVTLTVNALRAMGSAEHTNPRA